MAKLARLDIHVDINHQAWIAGTSATSHLLHPGGQGIIFPPARRCGPIP
jgi:hypothetical protein